MRSAAIITPQYGMLCISSCATYVERGSRQGAKSKTLEDQTLEETRGECFNSFRRSSHQVVVRRRALQYVQQVAAPLEDHSKNDGDLSA